MCYMHSKQMLYSEQKWYFIRIKIIKKLCFDCI